MVNIYKTIYLDFKLWSTFERIVRKKAQETRGYNFSKAYTEMVEAYIEKYGSELHE